MTFSKARKRRATVVCSTCKSRAAPAKEPACTKAAKKRK